MNVLYLISYRDMGGAETHLLSLLGHGDNSISKSLACIVKRDGQPVEIIERATRFGIPSWCIAAPGKFQLHALHLICLIVKSKNIHIIHSHGYKADLLGLLAARLCKKRIVTTLHGWTDSTTSLRLYKISDMAILRFFDRVICVSPKLVEQTARWKIPGSMVAMVYSGIDGAKFRRELNGYDKQMLKKELGIKNGSPIVGSVGRLSEEKGHKYLLQAAVEIKKEMPDVTFLIVGDGPLREELVRHAKDLDLEDSVVFAGYRTDIPQLLSIMDIFAQPSKREGLPITILEASIMQKPIVASDVGAVSAAVIDGKTGLLFRPCDVDGLVRGILTLLKNPDRMRQMGAAARKLVEANFSSESMVARIESIYRDVLR